MLHVPACICSAIDYSVVVLCLHAFAGAVYEDVYRVTETPTSFARYRSKPLSPSNQAAQLAKARAKADLAAALDLQIAEKLAQRESAQQQPQRQQQQQQQRQWHAAAPGYQITDRALSSPRQLALANSQMPNWQAAGTRTAAGAPLYQLNSSSSTYSSDNSSTCELLMQQVAAHEVALRNVQAQLRALQTITSYNNSPVTWQGADFTARSHGTGIQSRDPWKRFQQEDDQLDRLLNDYAASKMTPRTLPTLC
jgi:hypothetical protein